MSQKNMLWHGLLPQHSIARVVGFLASWRFRPWKNLMIAWYKRRFSVDLQQALIQDPYAYPNFQAFFARRLRPEARPISDQPKHITACADGRVMQAGRLEATTCLYAKGRAFTMAKLLGVSEVDALLWEAGVYHITYLSPRDYHRVHMPCDAVLTKMVHIHGRLYSVDPQVVAKREGLLAENERVVFHFDTAYGPMVLVMVGAFIVGSVVLEDDTVLMPASGKGVVELPLPEKTTYAKGDGLAYFRLGSCVVMACAFKSSVRWQAEACDGQSVVMGQTIGVLV